MYVFTILLELLLCFAGTTGGEFLALPVLHCLLCDTLSAPFPYFCVCVLTLNSPLLHGTLVKFIMFHRRHGRHYIGSIQSWRMKSANTIPGHLIECQK